MKQRLGLITLFSILMFADSATSNAQAQTAPTSLPPVVLSAPQLILQEPPPIMASATQLHIEGIYDVEVAAKGQEGSLPLTMIVKRDGEKLMASSKGSEYITITAIKVDGNNVTLTAAFQGFPFDMRGKLTEGAMRGTWEGGPNEGTWKALRHQEK